MNVETMIYAYLAVCASMILFNCVCIFTFRRRDQSRRNHSSRLEKDILLQLARLEDGKAVEQRHREYLYKTLVTVRGLRVLDETLEHMLEQGSKNVWVYLEKIAPVFTYLVLENRYRDSMQLTYFAYVVQKYQIIRNQPFHIILEPMMELLEEPGLYSRENALQAIYSVGDCGLVLRALHEVDGNGYFHYPKLLTDGLLTFPGDQKRLAGELWNDFETFSIPMQTVILDYIRFSGTELSRELLALLTDSHRDDELRFSCIRYFGRNPYEPAYPLLLDFAEQATEHRWEYAAIAVSALASYPGEHTIEVLKAALGNANWYIRFNAAKSLETFHLSYLELSDIMEGKDRYAREILQYWMDIKKAKGDGMLT